MNVKEIKETWHKQLNKEDGMVLIPAKEFKWLVEQAEEAERLNKQLSRQVEMGYRFEGMVHDLTKENKFYKQTLRDIGDIVTGIPSKMAKDVLKRFEK